MLFLAGLASSLYWPGISGAATSPRWLVLAIVPWLIRWQHPTIAHVIGGLFVTWAIATMGWNPAPLDGIQAIFMLLIGVACFCLGDQLIDLRKIWIGAAIGIGFSSAAAIAQYFGFRGILGLMPVHGLFVNENYMGEAAALVLVAVLAERIWWAVPLVAPALALSSARGALLALAVPFALKYRHKWWVLGLVLGCGAAAVWYVTLYKDPGSMPERILIWRGAWHGLTVFGHGIGSFWQVYPAFDMRGAVPDFPENAHNEFLTFAFETGYIGVALLLVFCAIVAIGPLTSSRMVAIAFLTEACFAFPFHLPTTALLGMVAAGHAVWDSYLVRGFADGRRELGRLLRQAAVPRIHVGVDLGAAPHAVRPSLSGISILEGTQ